MLNISYVLRLEWIPSQMKSYYKSCLTTAARMLRDICIEQE